MKRILLFLFILLSLSQVRASDTLTVRQVYNFNVGDTFDYKYTFNYYYNGSPLTNQTYARFIIIGKSISVGNDSVTYIRQQIYPSNKIDTLIYIDLDSSIFEVFDTAGVLQYIQFDTSHLSDGRLTNFLAVSIEQPFGYSNTFGNGLGVINSSFITGDDTYALISEELDTTLIYYAKGSDTSGTAFYIDTAGIKIYTPIPEECAFWNYYDNSAPYGIYQIRTGSKVFLNSHTYVELILRSFVNGVLYPDSSIGFFRNDTLGQKVYYTYTPGSVETLLYDFTIGNSLVYFNPDYLGINLNTIEIGNIKRTMWSFYDIPPIAFAQVGVSGGAIIGGIGSINCLFESGGPNALYNCGQHLEAFCVCGETLYPDTASGQCQLLTGINNIPSPSNIKVYPSPATDQIHLSYSDAGLTNVQLIITDIIGQPVYQSSVSQSETTHDISGLAAGIYTWRLVTDGMTIKTGKVVKQ